MIPSWSLLYTIKAGEEKEKLTFNWEHRKPLFPSCATIKAMFLKKNLLKSKPSGRHQMSSFYLIICVIFLLATLGNFTYFLSHNHESVPNYHRVDHDQTAFTRDWSPKFATDKLAVLRPLLAIFSPTTYFLNWFKSYDTQRKTSKSAKENKNY